MRHFEGKASAFFLGGDVAANYVEQRNNHPWRLYTGIKQKATGQPGQLALRNIKSTEIASNYKYCFAGGFNFSFWEV